MLIDYLNINIVLTKDYSNFVPKTSSTRQPHGFVQTGLEIRNLPRAVCTNMVPLWTLESRRRSYCFLLQLCLFITLRREASRRSALPVDRWRSKPASYYGNSRVIVANPVAGATVTHPGGWRAGAIRRYPSPPRNKRDAARSCRLE